MAFKYITEKKTTTTDCTWYLLLLSKSFSHLFIYLFSSFFYVHRFTGMIVVVIMFFFLLRSLSFLMSWLTNFSPHIHPFVMYGVVSRNISSILSLSLCLCHTTFNVHILCTYYYASASISSVFLSLYFLFVRFSFFFFTFSRFSLLIRCCFIFRLSLFF